MLFIISQLDVYTTADVSPAVLSNLGQKNGKQLWNKWLDVAREMRDLVPEYNDYARNGIPSGVGLIEFLDGFRKLLCERHNAKKLTQPPTVAVDGDGDSEDITASNFFRLLQQVLLLRFH